MAGLVFVLTSGVSSARGTFSTEPFEMNQRSLFKAELTLAQDRNNEYQGLVQLCKALGGGWK
jgi:hypothetical protein